LEDIMKTRFILVRHGQSLGNARRVFLGHTDWDLSELGKAQARCTARALADRKIDAVYSSDLLRARNTVIYEAEDRGIELVPMRGLREQFAGEWEGKSVERLKSEYGELFTVSWVRDFGIFKAPGGESIPELGERIRSTLAEIGEANRGMTVLIGCHAAAIRAFWGNISAVDPLELAERYPFPDNASYSEVDYEDGAFTPISYSVSEHLRDLITEIPF
jgi:broad specificity phosphatase PhoE